MGYFSLHNGGRREAIVGDKHIGINDLLRLHLVPVESLVQLERVTRCSWCGLSLGR